MNQKHIDLMVRHFQLEEQGDTPAVLADMCDPPTYLIPRWSSQPIHDPKRIAEIHAMLYDGFSPLRFKIYRMLADDHVGFCEFEWGGPHTGTFDGVPASGKEIWLHGVSTFTFRDGKIASETAYGERQEFLRQLREDQPAAEAVE